MVHPSICVPGTYRENNNKILNFVSCPEGTYNPIEGSTNSTDCLNCTAGVVCIGMGLSVVNSSNSRLYHEVIFVEQEQVVVQVILILVQQALIVLKVLSH